MAKISILGNAELSANGGLTVPSGYSVPFEYPPEELPPGGGKALLKAEEPFCVGTPDLWLFRGKVVRIKDAERLSVQEQRLEVINAVLMHERRYEKLSRQMDAYAQFEKTESARRERLPDKVKLFVWQRDEGKCVQCGSNARLEFDHIIPICKGGSNTERNIQLLCEKCNREKSGHL